MGWSYGYDDQWQRDVGYGVPAICDYPPCSAKIDRGLSYVCGSRPYGGEHGCGLYFCPRHLLSPEIRWDPEEGSSFCPRCTMAIGQITDSEWNNDFDFSVTPYYPSEDTLEWIEWKLTDDSWESWRIRNPDEVSASREILSSLVL